MQMPRHAKRSILQIQCDLIEILYVNKDKPLKPTHLMYRVNLGWETMHKYLGCLKEKNLIERATDGSYVLTEKGKRAATVVKELKRLFGDWRYW